MKLADITAELERFAPLNYQEDYDNSGLLVGDAAMQVNGALLSLDCTEAVVDEAIALGFNLIIAHHPILFTGLKKLSGNSYVERTLIKAIRNNVAIYACHTNLDNVKDGVNQKIAAKLGLSDLKVLAPKTGLLKKLVTYVPQSHHETVLNALFAAGAGHIGNYDSCSFNTEGTGTFRGNSQSNPFVGTPNALSRESELKIETIYEAQKESALVKALLSAHPYEEPAFDLYALGNRHGGIGSGLIGKLPQAIDSNDFLKLVKATFKVPVLKYTKPTGKPIQKVAVCGGSGRFLLKNAISAGADAYITADFKYHEFFDADGRLLLVDTGHFESEQFTPEIFLDIIKEKFPTFAVRLSEINTNPVNYF